MKKFALITVIAALALRQSNGAEPVLPPGYTSVQINLNVLEQGATNETHGATNFHFKNMRVENNDILGLVDDEFGTSFARTNGDQLVVSNIWGGQFLVLNKAGDVLLQNASSNTNGDDYHLYFHTSKPVLAGTQTTNKACLFFVTDCHLYYSSGDGTNKFHFEGFTSVQDQYSHGYTNSEESFQLCGGIGSLSFPDDGSYGVISGNIFGFGKNNAPAR